MTPPVPAAPAEERPSVVEKLWPPARQSVGRARRFLALHLEAWGLPELTDSAELVVSELLTNSVTHAHPPFGNLIATRFERLASEVRIEVHDADETWPEQQQAAADAECGRGLALVDALTHGRWGVGEREGVGKLVWAVVAEGNPGEGDR